MRDLSEPRPDGADTAQLFASYLDWYRATAIAKVSALDVDDQRRSILPSGWSPVELLSHLAYMERRWFVWGFLGDQVDAPWGDSDGERWHVAHDVGVEQVTEMLRAVGARTREILAGAQLEERAAIGGRFVADPPRLAWICFHVLQEYARHVGHLDIVVELSGGPTGE
ncbi:MAG: mycothiol transferase [Nocardioides sp.]